MKVRNRPNSTGSAAHAKTEIHVYIQTFWFEAVPNSAAGLAIPQMISSSTGDGFPAARFDFQQDLDFAV